MKAWSSRNKNAGLNSAFTVRKISHGYGVERVFQTHSAIIDSVEVKRRGKVRAGKLYYLRGLEGKKARIKEDLAAYAKAKARPVIPAQYLARSAATAAPSSGRPFAFAQVESAPPAFIACALGPQGNSRSLNRAQLLSLSGVSSRRDSNSQIRQWHALCASANSASTKN